MSKLTTFLDDHQLLNSKQFVFRQGKAVADLLCLHFASGIHMHDRECDTFVRGSVLSRNFRDGLTPRSHRQAEEHGCGWYSSATH